MLRYATPALLPRDADAERQRVMRDAARQDAARCAMSAMLMRDDARRARYVDVERGAELRAMLALLRYARATYDATLRALMRVGYSVTRSVTRYIRERAI